MMIYLVRMIGQLGRKTAPGSYWSFKVETQRHMPVILVEDPHFNSFTCFNIRFFSKSL